MNFDTLVLAPLVKQLQERYGSRRQYARMEASGSANDRLTSFEIRFLERRGDWNCPQHITPRYTAEEIRMGMQAVEENVRALENAALRAEVGRLRSE